MILAGIQGKGRRTPLRWAMIAAFSSGVAAAGVVVLSAPNGRAGAAARVQNRYVGDAWGYRRFALGNLVPELDQFRLGFRLISRIDPLFDAGQATRLSAWTTAIYDELENDAEFRALGSAMPHAYENLRGGGAASGHYFLYVPRRLNRAERQPALVFLHGSGGNFKAYTWLLAKVAERVGCVVIAPSFGMGDWRAPESGRVMQATLADAGRAVALDASRIHLMGLSNGGLGVSQIAAEEGGRFASLIYLSPVFDERAVNSATFAETWRGRDVLVLTGTEDNRTRFASVSEKVAEMRACGVKAELVEFKGADHFLFFSHDGAVLSQIEAWLDSKMGEAP
jgi:pimeloyl-ACP methyl ester carboxylesterase